MMVSGAAASFGGAVAIAAVSTAGDYVWANWISGHRPVYGLTHGAILFACVGLYLGAWRRKPGVGAAAGGMIGGLAAGSYYLLSPLAGRSSMFAIWIVVWLAVGILNERLRAGEITFKAALGRGTLAAVASGLAFYLVSGSWFPFNPQGWDYLAHFGAWTFAYLPGSAVFLMGFEPPSSNQ